jgi:TDG/mug DNA glycosylase family protein
MVAGGPSGPRTGSGLQAGSSTLRHTLAMGDSPWRPTREQLDAARDRTIPDVWADDLAVVFVGINPGLYSGAVGHHFARPGNRFWKALHRSGFTDREWSPFEDRDLPTVGLGITNLVARTTASAAELAPGELRVGRDALEAKVARHPPRSLAILGITAYRVGFGRKDAVLGEQREDLANVPVWVLPNPSGLNAHHQLDDLARRFGELRAGVGLR